MKTDKAWKEIIEELFNQFVDFFMPDLASLIDFSKKPEFLNNEFNQLFPDSVEDEKRVDKLVRVHLKDGSEKYLLLHIEIQSYKDQNFSKRMFQYFFRIYDKYGKDIEALAVYTYPENKYKENKFQTKFLNTELIYTYPIYDLAIQDIKALDESKNPFAFVIKTLMKSFNHKDSDQNNFEFKKELTQLLLNSDYSQQEIKRVFRFINFVFNIKDYDLIKKFKVEVEKMSTKEKRKFEFTDYDLAVSQERADEVTKQIALNLKKIGTDTETISKATGLTKEEIDEL